MKKKIFLITVFAFIIHYSLFINHCASQWVQMSNGMGANRDVRILASSGEYIFACTDSTIFRSSNNGLYWTAISNEGNFSYLHSLAVSGSNIFAGTWNGVYLSTNYGNNWTAKGLNGNVNALAIFGSYVFAGTIFVDSARIYYSMNLGNTWNRCSFPNLMVFSFAVNTFIFACTWTGGVYRSNNNGLNWYAVNNGLPINYGGHIISKGEDLFTYVFPGGVYRSTNYGGNWVAVNNGLIDSGGVLSFAVKDNYIFVGTNGRGIFLSTNNGGNWINKSSGMFIYSPIASILIYNNYIFVGTGDSSIWRRNLSEIIGINKISEVIPKSFLLEQNYPNPFNPTTNIKYQITNNSFVKLIVFNALGQKVEILVNEKQNAGVYEVTFDGSNLSSGIYFYKLETENFSDVKKMILIK